MLRILFYLSFVFLSESGTQPVDSSMLTHRIEMSFQRETFLGKKVSFRTSILLTFSPETFLVV